MLSPAETLESSPFTVEKIGGGGSLLQKEKNHVKRNSVSS